MNRRPTLLLAASCVLLSHVISPAYTTDSTIIGELNLCASSEGTPIVVVAPDAADALEQYAVGELTKHVEQVTGRKPEVLVAAKGELPNGKNVIVFGRLENNPLLRTRADRRKFRPNDDPQGFAIRIAKRPDESSTGTWLAVLCGDDAHGALYAVRDFAHYYFYRNGEGDLLRPADVSYAPVIKVRQLSDSGCNLFSAENSHERFMFTVHYNRDTYSATFDKHHYIDWLSEWKISTIAFFMP